MCVCVRARLCVYVLCNFMVQLYMCQLKLNLIFGATNNITECLVIGYRICLYLYLYRICFVYNHKIYKRRSISESGSFLLVGLRVFDSVASADLLPFEIYCIKLSVLTILT